MIKAFIFDLDGTILDTVPDIALAVNKTLGSDLSVEQISSFLGNGLLNLINDCIKASGYLGDAEEAYKNLLKNYSEYPVVYTKPYPGVSEFLTELNKLGIAVGVFSNKEQSLADYIIHTCFPTVDIPFIAGRNGKYKAKPDTEAVFAFCKEEGISINELMYVGDSEVDYKCASECGCKVKILSWGTRTKKYLVQAGVPEQDIVDKISDIKLI